MHLTFGRLLGGFLVVVMAVGIAGGARAASMDQAIAQCKEQFTPLIRECVRRKMGGQRGDPQQHIPGCKAAMMGQIKSCVARLIGAAGLKSNSVDAAGAPAAKHIQLGSANRTVPPKTIADITAILDQEKPDPIRLKKLQASADATPLARGGAAAANFYYNRSLVRGELGRFREAVEDDERAVQAGTGHVDQLVFNAYRMNAVIQLTAAGDPKAALAKLQKIAEDGERSGERGFLFTVYRQIAYTELTLGNYDRARTYMQKLQALWKNAHSIRGFDSHARTWEANIEDVKGRIFEAHGQLADAVRAYERGENLRRSNIEKSATAVIAIPRSQLQQSADLLLLAAAFAKTHMGRFAEGEADARRALLNRLQATGKYNTNTARYISALGALLLEQGRYDEAKKLLAATLDIYQKVGVAEDSQVVVYTMSTLASVAALQGRWTEAGKAYADVERATKNWAPARREGGLLTNGYIETLYKTNRIEAGLEAAGRLLELRRTQFGDWHPDTVLARGHYAVGLARTAHNAEALKEFQAAVPKLTAANFETDTDDVLNAAARTRYTQVVVETYIDLLSRMRQGAGTDVAAESFRLAEAMRSRAVQKALTSAGARMTTGDPKLAALVRQEQDLRQQIGTQLSRFNNLLALPAAQCDETGIAAARGEIDGMRAQHTKVRAAIDRQFPDYADLIDPQPPTPAQIGEVLRPSEVLLSFYFGREASFVWAIAPGGKAQFAALPESVEAIEAKVKKLRLALEPRADTIDDIPAFDLALSHALYKTLLEPVKAQWADAKSLIVVTNGALGLLPLGILTTASYQLPQGGPVFAGYRGAPWLARTHAVTMVPSAAALRTLRRLPQASPARDKLIAFGDPIFNDEQAAEAGAAVKLASIVQTRGIPLKRRAAPQTEGAESVTLAQLPRLPDTADELRAIALALQADPAKALHLGKDANEQSVKKANLVGFKIVAFATHGLVPGELDGLTQPALALSAPQIAGVEGDGLLTMEKILSLKLDADWVVLSACNTGAGAGAGAEAASGLGRAFFYAGTRAILVTNWSVHSQSARELITDLFRRQATDAKLSRAEALRQAMMGLLDGRGFTDEKGATLFAYAHPLFWAPYSIIGDGG